VVRLHGQYYTRLPAADRLGHAQSLVDHDDPAVRALVVGWAQELLPGPDAVGQRALADLVLKLSGDPAVEVQRPAVLALGRVRDARAADRLQHWLQRGEPPVRAVAARALAQQATGPGPDAEAARRLAVPALQKALDDPALEVVVEAAEDLGALGLPEAGPVLSALLRHPSEPARQAAAQALERTADLTVLDGLLRGLDDAVAAVRFGLVGAVGHAVGDGRSLADPQRSRICARLEDLLARDPDPGVRSRAATVLGECGGPSVLPALWQRVQAAEDARVQEKAWAAMLRVLARGPGAEAVHAWDQRFTELKQPARRTQLWAAVHESWKKKEDPALAQASAEALVQAQLEEGKWAAALPVLRELLPKADTDAERAKQLAWLLAAGEQALKAGNAAEARRAAQDAQPYLHRTGKLSAEFEALARSAGEARPEEVRKAEERN
jgi:HEAT repeat protein